MFLLEPSLNEPVAVNACCPPFAMETLAGLMAIETRLGGVTNNAAVPEMAPKAAEIVVVPCEIPVAKPELPIAATPELLELHVTSGERFAVEPSE